MPTIAELIATRLTTGLVHPGGGDQPPMTMNMPGFRPTVMVPEVKKQIELTAKLIGEAIVHLIETEGHSEIVDSDELERLRITAAARPEGHNTVAVHCRCDRKRVNPLMHLAVAGDQVLVDGPQLITGIAGLSPRCPHRRVVG